MGAFLLFLFAWFTIILGGEISFDKFQHFFYNRLQIYTVFGTISNIV